MSNAALAKILRGVCAALVLGISFPIAGQAQMHGGTHLMVPERQSPFRDCARSLLRDLSRGIGAAPRQLLLRRRIVYSSLYRRGISSWRLGSYGDWRQSYWPHWGWDVAAGLLATAPAYYSYYYGVGLRRRSTGRCWCGRVLRTTLQVLRSGLRHLSRP